MIDLNKECTIYLHDVSGLQGTFTGTATYLDETGIELTRSLTQETGFEKFFIPWNRVRYTRQRAERPR